MIHCDYTMKNKSIRPGSGAGPWLFMGVLMAFQAHGATPSLKDTFKDCFVVGAALNQSQIFGEDTNGLAVVRAQFNSITPENILKWERIHPTPTNYNFEPADRYVEFGEQNGMFIVGHTLIWHSQTPGWVFKNEDGTLANRETLLNRMHDHIATVVGRYKGRVKGWDVVNEALSEEGVLRESRWKKIIGEDYILKAFQFAHEADPDAELYYNDFSLENAPKRAGAIALIQKLQASGAHISGVGLQGHYKMDWPTTQQIDETITDFQKLGIKVHITELDVDVLPQPSQNRTAEVGLRFEGQAKFNPYPRGLPLMQQRQLARRYAEVFKVLVNHRDEVERVTFWGVSDSDSWLNNWPIRGRTSYPLLFDRELEPKPAFKAVIKTAPKN